MKKRKIPASAILTVLLVVLGISVSTKADSPSTLLSRGKIEFDEQGVVFDSRDFDELDRAITQGKENSYNSGYTTGYADGQKSVKPANTTVEYIYHKHKDGNGNEVSGETNTTAGGCFTVYHNDPIYTWTPCGGGLDYVYNDGHPYARCNGRCGATYSIDYWMTGAGCNGSVRTLTGYNRYYSPSCGHRNGEMVGVTILYE